MAILLAVAALLLLVVQIGSGVSAVTAVVLVAMVALQALAGMAVWSLVGRPRSGAELFGVGTAIGTGLALASGVLGSLVGASPWSWIVVPLVVLVGWLVAAVRGHGRVHTARVDAPTWLALGVGAVLGVGLIAVNLRNYPLTWTGSWSGYHTDMPFFEALATSLTRLGPLDSIFVPGAQIRYHWLTYAWAGQLTETSSAEPFVVMTRLLPTVAVLAAVAMTAAWARRVSTQTWVPTLAVVLLTTGGFLGAVYGGVLNFDSPSQAMGVVWLLAYAIALGALLRDDPSRRFAVGLVLLLAFLAFLLTGGKVSAAAPALAGVVCVALVGLFRREPWMRRAVAAAGGSLIAAALSYVLILAGSTGSGGLGVFNLVDRASSQQGLNPVDGMIGVVLGTAVLVVAMAARWAGLAWLVATPRHRWDPLTVFGAGMALAGLISLAVFNGFNEIWFGLAASAPLAVLSAQGAGDAVELMTAERADRSRRLLWGVFGAAVVVYVVVFGLWQTGASGGNVFVSTLRWTGPLVGVAVALTLGAGVGRWTLGTWTRTGTLATTVIVLVLATAPGRLLGAGTGQVGIQQPGLRNEWFSVGSNFVKGRDRVILADWSASKMDAARWLRANAHASDLLATNLTLGPFVPGVTGLPTLASGILYQIPYGGADVKDRILANESLAWDFIDSPTAQTAGPLCAAGVRWVWVDPALTAARRWSPYAEIVHQAEDVTILRLGCPA